MFKEALAWLQAHKLDFSVSSESATLISAVDSLIGFKLSNTVTPSPRYGGELVLTVDLTKQSLRFVQFIIGWCLLNVFDIASTIYDANQPLYEEYRSPRQQYFDPPQLIRPRREQQWSFYRPNSPKADPDEWPKAGWPIEKAGSLRWYFGGCAQAEWAELQGVAIYRCSVVTEFLGVERQQTRELKLEYEPDKLPFSDAPSSPEMIKPALN